MSNLLDQLDDDATNVFLTDFGETVTYYPLDGALPPREIKAIVDRELPQSPGVAERAPLGQLRISVANSATLGISSAEINMGGDVIRVAKRIGEVPVDMRIVSKPIEDRGMLELELT